MSDRWPGGIIRSTPVVPTGPFQTGTAPGVWTMDQAAYWIKQNLWPTQGVQAADPYFPYTTLLLSSTALGNANNNLFVDSSGAFNPLSRNGNTTQGSVTPYSANWSNYFDGSGDYLSLASSDAFRVDEGDWTMEAWVYLNTTATNHTFINRGTFLSAYSFYFGTSGTSLYYEAGTGGWAATPYTSSAGAVSANQWIHVAAVRSGTSLFLYANGTRVLNQASASFGANTATPVWIGTYLGGTATLNGNMSNFRFVKGTALYTGATYTVPTTPLAPISGTSLLTCQSNRFRDAGPNNFTVTPNGNPSVTDFSPFNPTYPGLTYNQNDIANWSGYFDGSGDYLQTPSNAAFALNGTSFTIEAWVYVTSSSEPYQHVVKTSGATNNLMYIDYSGGSNGVLASQVGGTIASQSGVTLNTWHHLAVVRNGTSVTSYVNGVGGTPQTIDPGGSGTVSLIIATDGGPSPIRYFNGYISNLRVVKGTAVYTANFTPPTSPLTAVSGTSLLTLQNAAFTDNSTNNFVVTPNGNVTVTGNSPFNPVGYWSNYFDGSGDYLEIANNAALQLGTGDFTIETSFFISGNAALNGDSARAAAIMSKYPTSGGITGYFLIVNGNSTTTGTEIIFGNVVSGTFYLLTYTATITQNTWHHVAVVRSGTTTTLYYDGVSVASTTLGNQNVDGSTNPLRIGTLRYPNYLDDFPGYISNFRIVKGTAVYTSNFTPPTTPLTAISGTSLLTCQNAQFIDNSTNALTVTPYGNTSIQSFDPFYTATIASNGGSVYFDGSGDYLVAANNPSLDLATGDFTVEAWFYPTQISQGLIIGRNNGNYATQNDLQYGLYLSSGSVFARPYQGGTDYSMNVGTPQLNAWNHAALVRTGNTFYGFLNGVRGSTSQTISGALNTSTWSTYLGAALSSFLGNEFFTGYTAGVRITRGTALYTNSTYTVPTAPVTPSPATTLLVNGMNAGIFDATATNDMETVGNAQASTAVSKFSGSSLYLDGTGDWLKFPQSPQTQFGSGNFTIEFWTYRNTSGDCVFYGDRDVTDYNGITIGIRNNYVFLLASDNGSTWGLNTYSSTAGNTVPVTTWTHIAVVRSGGTWAVYIDGVQSYTRTFNVSVRQTAPLVYIGTDGTGLTPLNGYMDDLRVTKGIARYTSNFTPPTQAFPTY